MQGLGGAIAPIPTPVDRDGIFDRGALAAHLEWLAGENLDGVLVLGTNGEFPSFTCDERLRIADVAAARRGPLQLLLGVGACAIAEVVEMTRRAADLGCTAVLVPPPFYFRSAPISGIASFFRRVLDEAKLPVLLYHIPQVTGIAISDELLALIEDHPRLAGVKDSSGRHEELDRLCARAPGWVYLVGHDRLVSRAVAAGGQGSISAAASVAPALVKAVQNDSGRQPELDSVRGLLEEYGLGPAVKAILAHRGMGPYATRPPLEGLSPERGAELIERYVNLRV